MAKGKRPQPLNEQFADRRRRAGLSQTAVAEASGVLQKTISLIETGAGDPRLSSLVACAAALGCEICLVRPRAGRKGRRKDGH